MSRAPENCRKVGLKICQAFTGSHGSGSTGRWWQLCVRRQSGNWATALMHGRAPTYFPNRAPLRQNPALDQANQLWVHRWHLHLASVCIAPWRLEMQRRVSKCEASDVLCNVAGTLITLRWFYISRFTIKYDNKNMYSVVKSEDDDVYVTTCVALVACA